MTYSWTCWNDWLYKSYHLFSQKKFQVLSFLPSTKSINKGPLLIVFSSRETGWIYKDEDCAHKVNTPIISPLWVKLASEKYLLWTTSIQSWSSLNKFQLTSVPLGRILSPQHSFCYPTSGVAGLLKVNAIRFPMSPGFLRELIIKCALRSCMVLLFPPTVPNSRKLYQIYLGFVPNWNSPMDLLRLPGPNSHLLYKSDLWLDIIIKFYSIELGWR